MLLSIDLDLDHMQFPECQCPIAHLLLKCAQKKNLLCRFSKYSTQFRSKFCVHFELPERLIDTEDKKSIPLFSEKKYHERSMKGQC